MIKGLYETHLFVENLESSISFYKNDLKLHLAHTEIERKAAFFWIGEEKQSMLGLWEKPKDQIDIRHFAFQCDLNFVLNEASSYLISKGITPHNFLQDGTYQPMVFAWMPALSIYFEDPDGHSLEFISMLEGQSRPEGGIISFDEWLALENN